MVRPAPQTSTAPRRPVFIPGAVLEPGAHWNYEAGYCALSIEFLHWTVGTDSRALIRNRGLAAVLVRDGVIYQYAPLNARCFTQCEWNPLGWAIEIESLDGSVDDRELEAVRYITQWALGNGLIPNHWYNGPRMPIGTPFAGVTAHANLVHRQCDMHSDGYDDWFFEHIFTPYVEDDMFNDDDRLVLHAIWQELYAKPDGIGQRIANATDEGLRQGAGPGLVQFSWRHPDVGRVVDTIGIADDGSVFTTSGLEPGHVFFISGPRSQSSGPRPRYQGPSHEWCVPTLTVRDGQLRFVTQARYGRDGPGTGVVEHYWNPADVPGDDGSRWGSYLR